MARLTLTHLQPVLETLAWLKNETSVWFEITNLMIPTLNDDRRKRGSWPNGFWLIWGRTCLCISPRSTRTSNCRTSPRTPPETLDSCAANRAGGGPALVYEGNIYSDGANTHCPKCDELLVRRSWHDVLENRIAAGGCPKCGLKIPGVWANDAKGKRWLKQGVTSAAKAYRHLNL